MTHFGKGQQILRPGDDIPKAIFITDGLVSEYDISPSGNSVVINLFKPGAFFPMSCVLNQQKSEYFFEAVAPVTVHMAPTDHVLEFLEQNPDVMLDLLKRVFKGTDGILRRMTYLMGGSAKSRVSYELLNAAYRFGDTLPDGRTHLTLSENDIAKRSGLSRETVNRAMKELKKDRLVLVVKNGIELQNITTLEASLNM